MRSALVVEASGSDTYARLSYCSLLPRLDDVAACCTPLQHASFAGALPVNFSARSMNTYVDGQDLCSPCPNLGEAHSVVGGTARDAQDARKA